MIGERLRVLTVTVARARGFSKLLKDWARRGPSVRSRSRCGKLGLRMRRDFAEKHSVSDCSLQILQTRFPQENTSHTFEMRKLMHMEYCTWMSYALDSPCRASPSAAFETVRPSQKTNVARAYRDDAE